jgi:hypothetical protein
MLKPQMLEAIFVAGSVLAGMTGSFMPKMLVAFCVPKVLIALCPPVRVEAPLHWRIMDPRSLREPIGSVESLSKIPFYR